jgi:hypothetical protein
MHQCIHVKGPRARGDAQRRAEAKYRQKIAQRRLERRLAKRALRRALEYQRRPSTGPSAPHGR